MITILTENDLNDSGGGVKPQDLKIHHFRTDIQIFQKSMSVLFTDGHILVFIKNRFPTPRTGEVFFLSSIGELLEKQIKRTES